MGSMKRRPSLVNRALSLHLVIGPGSIYSGASAAESDLSTTVGAPAQTHLGQIIHITVGYANAGPDTAGSACINAYIPSGVPAPLDQLTQEQRNALQASAEGTDTLGNAPLLFEDEEFCEHLITQLQRDDEDEDAHPIQGLDPGVTASFAFELEIPMEAPRFGRVSITEPPLASFTYSPDHPTVGQVIQFTDTSTGGPPTEWTWDFGDGVGTSTEQNPSYTYTVGGTYTVSLTVSNSVGSDTSEQTIFTCCGGEMSFISFIPAAAFAAGAEGAFFQTDLDVNNAGPAMASYAFEWLPRGADNTSPLTSSTLTLGSGNSARYTNIVSEVFGLEPDAVGALAIISDSPHLIALSRTYNLDTVKQTGTFGQALPAVPAPEMIPSDERRRIIFMTQNDDFRSNIGCQNGTTENLRIMIELFDDSGASLDILQLDLPPMSNDQLNQVFADHAPVNGAADVWTVKPDATFTCYGSLLDNGTNDPTTILPK
jgi:PKD repeat protein